MSAAHPVELLDDEEDDGDSNAPPIRMNQQEENAIQLFVEVTNSNNRTNAIQLLTRANFNVQQALALSFGDIAPMNDNDNDTNTNRHGNNEVVVEPATAPATEEEERRGAAISSTIRNPYRKISPKQQQHQKQQPKETIIRTLEVNENNNNSNKEDVLVKPPLGVTPSTHWHTCMSSVTDRFVDPDFPPSRSSLDGRQSSATTIHMNSKSNNDSTIGASTAANFDATTIKAIVTTCVCGLPAASKTVQSDGPNYGRFYFACGVQGRGKAVAKCKFFQWDASGRGESTAVAAAAAGYATRYTSMRWEFFGLPQHSLVHKQEFSPDAVRQGAVGNCWFLSALAVVAEQAHLVQALLPHAQLNNKGVYQINFCLDGKWTPILVDSHLPVITKGGSRIIDPLRGGTTSSVPQDGGETTVAIPAFCATPLGQLWPALIEKAYAKAHGSYERLSGGFIQEAFGDMTGAPCETLIFDGKVLDFDELWARLLSFHEAGFLMGVATSKGGDGLVGGHAYSILDVIEVNDALVGGQQTLTNFFGKDASPPTKKQRTTIRLVRIRNPWGKKEWKGEWSADSDQWTRALRNKLGKAQSFVKGDGTFFISYQDMLQRFHHMDVAKCHNGWTHACCDGMYVGGDALASSKYHYRLSIQEKTYCFVSTIQPKKRANTKTQYYYADSSMIIVKRRSGEIEWECEQVILSGTSRSSAGEVFLDPLFEYKVVPFSYKDCKAPFRITTYSAKVVNIAQAPRNEVESDTFLSILHRHLLKGDRKLQYVVAPHSLLVCSHGYRCLYFTAINGSPDYLLSLRVILKLQKGLVLSHGESGETFDIPPKSQAVLLVVSGDGTMSSAVSMKFTYASDTIAVSGSNPVYTKKRAIGSSVDLSIAGELLVQGVDPGCTQVKGGDTVETYHWIAQIGASA